MLGLATGKEFWLDSVGLIYCTLLAATAAQNLGCLFFIVYLLSLLYCLFCHFFGYGIVVMMMMCQFLLSRKNVTTP